MQYLHVVHACCTVPTGCAKYIAAIIYISSITIMLMALVTFALGRFINVGNGIFVVGITLLTTTFLMLVYVPKVREYIASYIINMCFWHTERTQVCLHIAGLIRYQRQWAVGLVCNIFPTRHRQ